MNGYRDGFTRLPARPPIRRGRPGRDDLRLRLTFGDLSARGGHRTQGASTHHRGPDRVRVTAKVSDQASLDRVCEGQPIYAQRRPPEILVAQPVDEAPDARGIRAEHPKAVSLGSCGQATRLPGIERRALLDRAPGLDREWASRRDRADDRPDDYVTLGDVLDDDADRPTLVGTVHRPFVLGEV
jgi:hypothetical protein